MNAQEIVKQAELLAKKYKERAEFYRQEKDRLDAKIVDTRTMIADLETLIEDQKKQDKPILAGVVVPGVKSGCCRAPILTPDEGEEDNWTCSSCGDHSNKVGMSQLED